MPRTMLAAALPAAALAAAVLLPGPASRGGGALRPPAAFEEMADRADRARALFTEAGKVLTHPRCINCHPAGDSPLQGEDGRRHEPPVARGTGGLGAVGMQCATCHLERNFDPGRVPGAPTWHLAPRRMAWEGLTLGELCAQLKDPARNGGRDLEAIAHHMEEDALVGWGWEPGEGREPAPGSQERFGELIRAWVDSGAECP